MHRPPHFKGKTRLNIAVAGRGSYYMDMQDNAFPNRLDEAGVPTAACPKRWNPTLWAIAAAMAVVTILAYMGVSQCSFLNLDDTYYVTDNYHVKRGLTNEGVAWALTSFSVSNWHPLTWLSHMLDVQLYGMDPAGHHITSLVLHTINALLLLWLLYRMTGDIWPSAFVAAIFALHPLHVESVAWVSERKDVLSTCLWLLTMLAYVSYAQDRMRSRYLLALGLFALGLMAKPMLVTLPLVLLLVDYWPLAREGVSFHRLAVEKVPFAGLSGISVILTLIAQRSSMVSGGIMDIPTRLTNAIVSYGRYIWMMLWPTDLAAYYPHGNRPQLAAAIVIGVLLVMMTAVAIGCRRRFPYVLTGWLWYLITLVPVIGLIQVGDQSHADRYTYVPLTGIFVAIAWAAQDLLKRVPSGKVPLSILAAIVLIAASASTRRNIEYWKDSVTLFTHTLAVAPENPRIEAYLGCVLEESGKPDTALPHLIKAISYRFNDGAAYGALGKVYAGRGDVDKAIGYYAEANKHPWMRPVGERNLGVYLVSLGRYDEALPHLEKAVELNPYCVDAQSLLVVALAEKGRLADSKKAMERAMRIGGDTGIAHFTEGYMLAKTGDIAGAIKAYRKSIAIEPSYAAYSNLAQLQAQTGRAADSEESLRRAISLEPNRAEAHANLAMLLAAIGQKDKALDEARRAMELAPNDPDIQTLCKQLAEGK